MLKKYIKHTFLVTAVIGSTMACEPEIDREIPSYEQARGEADFSVYVALGNSLTAGVADGTLNRSGQINSYPAIIANKLDYIVPDFEFDQPLLPEGRLNGTLVLQEIIPGPPLTPVIVQEAEGLSQAVVLEKVSGNFNNLGVPKAKVADLTKEGYATLQENPLFARFASSANATIVGDAVAQNPTFFTLWIGNNDVLGYATAGGEGTITAPATFEEEYRKIVDQLVASNPQIEGAIANIPSVSDIPFLRAVSWNRFNLEAGQATQINVAIEAKINPEIRKGVIYGVIKEGARRQIIVGIVQEGARRQVIAQVAPAVVYQQAYQKAIAAGLNEAEADAAAKEYVASTDGQNDIANLQTSLVTTRTPEEVYDKVEEKLTSEAVQTQINKTATAAFEDETILGEAGVDALNTTLASPEVQTQINKNYEAALQADAAGQLEQAIGAEGVAAVEENIILKTEDFKADGYYPVFAEGPNGFVVDDPESPTGIRQLNSNDLVTLTVSSASASEFNPTGGDITIPGKYVLDQKEQKLVSAAIANYNQIIAEIATENTFALVDMNAFFDQIVEGGITEEGTTFTAAFITGNAFSLDGVHLTQKGYALVAKKFIQEINSYYKSDIPLPNVRNYPAVALP